MDISIIIVNYNTFEITCNCLTSVLNSKTSCSLEVILIDNNSKDKNPDLFLQKFPYIKLIVNHINLGFGAANNEGMRIAKGKYILLLNSDTIIDSDTLEKCYQFIKSDFARKKNIGLVGCKILNPNGSIQPSVFPYLKNNTLTFLITSNPLINLILKLLKKDRHTSFNFNKTQQVGDISGAFMFLSSKVGTTAGYFDTDFFMYCEDTEWCRERISKYYSIYYYPDTSIIHLGGQSAPQAAMFVQNKLSLSLLWYKKGTINYLFYIIISYTNCLLMLSLSLFVKSESRTLYLKYIKAYISLFTYLIFDIPKFARATDSRRETLIHRSLKNMLFNRKGS